jgi:hypothetical protein
MSGAPLVFSAALVLPDECYPQMGLGAGARRLAGHELRTPRIGNDYGTTFPSVDPAACRSSSSDRHNVDTRPGSMSGLRMIWARAMAV